MASGAPFLVIEAAAADALAAAAAGRKTAATIGVVTGLAFRDAACAKGGFAAAAGSLAVVADRSFTLFAVETLFGGDEIAAIGAGLAVPVRQRHKRALGVVGPQQIRHEHEKIQQSALVERLPDGLTAIAFTKRFIDHVRMGDALAGCGWVRIERDHPVRRLGFQPGPVEPDLEGAQKSAFEGDRFGRHGEPVRFVVEAKPVELLFHRHQIVIDVGGRSHECAWLHATKRRLQLQQLGLQNGQ